MPVIALQGLRGGMGTTSVTAALAWALQQLGESVLAIDFAPDNLLRLHFNMPFGLARGWARAEQDGGDWQQGAMRYCEKLDFLPFGRLTATERLNLQSPAHWQDRLAQLAAGVHLCSCQISLFGGMIGGILQRGRFDTHTVGGILGFTPWKGWEIFWP